MAFKTEAIVLHARTLKGADRIYELLTPRDGKLSVVARGAGKSTSKMAGHLAPFAHVKLMIGRGRQDHFAGAATIRSFSKLRENWFDFILASSLVELLQRINVPGIAAHDEFDLLRDTLERLSDTALPKREKVLIARIFLWKILTLSGWRPNLTQCALCQRRFDGGNVYYQAVKGFICSRHSPDGMLLAEGLLPFLETIMSDADWNEIVEQAGTNGLEKQWLQISQVYYQDVISYPLQSLKLFSYAP
jgi:DNA repair protein RecO (recombination protein O)